MPSFLRRACPRPDRGQESISVFVTYDVTGKKMDPRVREDDDTGTSFLRRQGSIPGSARTVRKRATGPQKPSHHPAGRCGLTPAAAADLGYPL